MANDRSEASGQAQEGQVHAGQAQDGRTQDGRTREGQANEPPSRDGAPRPEAPAPPPLEAVTTVTTVTTATGAGAPAGSLEGASGGAARGGPAPGWTFLTNHAHVLFCLACDGDLTMRELAARVGVTERAVQAIVADLVDGGYVNRTRVGRRNSYTVNLNGRLRHPLESKHSIGDLINALL